MKFFPEAAFRRFFKIGVFKNFENSQENTCARVSFLVKLQALGLQFY